MRSGGCVHLVMITSEKCLTFHWASDFSQFCYHWAVQSCRSGLEQLPLVLSKFQTQGFCSQVWQSSDCLTCPQQSQEDYKLGAVGDRSEPSLTIKPVPDSPRWVWGLELLGLGLTVLGLGLTVRPNPESQRSSLRPGAVRARSDNQLIDGPVSNNAQWVETQYWV